jgi:alpha-tubulin suppressor-like RCC1 family protein
MPPSLARGLLAGTVGAESRITRPADDGPEMKHNLQGFTMQAFRNHQGSLSMKALAAMLAGCLLAGGCGPVVSGDERAPDRTVQSIRAAAAVHVDSGRYHQVMLRSDGTVWTLGDNRNGQLGTGVVVSSPYGGQTVNPEKSAMAVQVQGLPTDARVVSVAAGDYHSLVLLSDGRVYGWGRGTDGALGSAASNGIQVTPVQVLFPSAMTSSVVALSAGGYYSLALLADGTVMAWGYGAHGVLGTGSVAGVVRTPVKVQLPTTSPVVGIASGLNHNLAVLADGTVHGWGDNTYGQLGSATPSYRATPTQVPGLSSATDVAAGHFHSLALAGGQVYSWGSNGVGQLGDGQLNSYGDPLIPSRVTPGLVVNLTGVTHISAGYTHSLAVDASGTTWIWGDSDFAQGGMGTDCTGISYPHKPNVKIVTPLSRTDLPGPVTFISGGGEDTSVIEIDDGTTRTFWGWGLNNYNQVGPTIIYGPYHGGHVHTPRQLL